MLNDLQVHRNIVEQVDTLLSRVYNDFEIRVMAEETETPKESNPVEAIESTAEATAESIQDVTSTITENVDEATGSFTSSAADELQDRITTMEGNIQELRDRIGQLPGLQQVGEASEQLEETVSDVGETVEQPVHVTVEKTAETAPTKNFFPRWWPKWL